MQPVTGNSNLDLRINTAVLSIGANEDEYISSLILINEEGGFSTIDETVRSIYKSFKSAAEEELLHRQNTTLNSECCLDWMEYNYCPTCGTRIPHSNVSKEEVSSMMADFAAGSHHEHTVTFDNLFENGWTTGTVPVTGQVIVINDAADYIPKVCEHTEEAGRTIEEELQWSQASIQKYVITVATE